MARRTRRSRRISVALISASGLLIVVAPASAGGLRDVTVVQRSSLVSSSTSKRLSVACPAGESSLGGAAFVSPALGNLGLFAAGTSTSSWVAGASETDFESAAWRLNARALCATFTSTPPPKNGAATYVKAVSIGRNHTANNSLRAKFVTATCPAGKTAISGGGRIGPPNIGVAFTAMQRVNANRAWRVAAHEVDVTGAPWTLYASVVCANVISETATADYAATFSSPGQASPVSSMPLQSVAPTCSPGWSVVGGGAHVEGAAPGSPPPSDIALTSSEPTGNGSSSSAWIAIAHETDPTNQTWRVVAQVICSALNGGPPA